MEALKKLIGQEVEKLFLVVWPPLGEDKASDIDISFGFIFQNEPDQICIITTDKNDLWTPHIRFENTPTITYPWSHFNSRMNAWMKSKQDNPLEIEYYEVTKAVQFSAIVSNKILAIEFIGLVNHPEPFGVKVIFEDDYILSSPISDGNTVETSLFHQNKNIINFETLGKVEYKRILP